MKSSLRLMENACCRDLPRNGAVFSTSCWGFSLLKSRWRPPGPRSTLRGRYTYTVRSANPSGFWLSAVFTSVGHRASAIGHLEFHVYPCSLIPEYSDKGSLVALNLCQCGIFSPRNIGQQPLCVLVAVATYVMPRKR